MAIQKITESWLSAVTLPESQADYFDHEPKGFGVRVAASGRKTFFVMTRVAQKKTRITIGALGEPRSDSPIDPRTGAVKIESWTVKNAREKAREVIGAIVVGAPLPVASAKAGGPTLRDAITAHQEKMTKRKSAARSIANAFGYPNKYLPEWIDRPIEDLTGPVLCAIHDRIKANARTIKGIANAKGASTANKTITTVGACWNSLNRKLQGKLGTFNPARAVVQDSLAPSKKRLGTTDMIEWFARVQTLTPVRRDLAIFVLFSAMRTQAARVMRWEHIDWKAGTFHIPRPKGGEEKAFTLPLGPTLREILERRQAENDFLMRHHGGDNGWIFPTVRRNKSADGTYEVIPVAEPKEQRTGADGKKYTYIAGPHVLRRTYLSVAHEIGLSVIDKHVLANHSFGNHDVNERYISTEIAHLTKCQRKVDAAIRSRLGVDAKGDLISSDITEAVRKSHALPLAAPHRARKAA